MVNLRWVIVLLAVLLAGVLPAQKQANQWFFGLWGGLSFNTDPPSPLWGGQTTYPPPNQWNEGTSVLCDSSGNLLCYSNGYFVWDRLHQVMPNGAGLMGHPSSTHAALIVPRPGSERYFDLFTTDGSENWLQNGLRHSLIDICLNGGLGDIVPGSKNELLHPQMAEKLAAVRHGNGVDYWIITHEYNTNVFHNYLLTAAGVTDSVTIAVGPDDVVGWGGQIVLSPDGGTIAYAATSLFGHLALYDFDRWTGVVSNARVWPNDIAHMAYGLAFSPSGERLYMTTGNQGTLRQLDLSAGSWAAIQASEVVLGAIVPDRWRDLLCGPDGRIYVSNMQLPTLGVVQFPDSLGSACGFVDGSVPISGLCSFGLPTVITAYDYSNTYPDCVIHAGVQEHLPAIRLSPNPAVDHVLLHHPEGSRPRSCEVVHLSTGRVEALPWKDRTRMEVDVSRLPAGCYLFRVIGGDGTVLSTKLLVQ